MFYSSTRNNDTKVASADAIIKGLAPDRGLYTPVSIPVLTATEIDVIKSGSYKDAAKLIFAKYLTDFSEKQIAVCVDSAYGDSFEEVAPLYQLNDQASVLELWHGPTCAFKDVALQVLPYLMTTAIDITGEKNDIAIIVATSGDTGKAALEGFKDVAGTKIIVMYPSEGVSAVQKQQMVTQEGDNVSVIAINGNFDDAQTAAKNIFTDDVLNATLLAKGIKLSSANSINWGRLLPQIVYYVKSSIDLGGADYVVPTGNFGNILAAYFAKMMGAPVKKLVCASNQNNVLTEFIKTGVYDRRREFFKTLSPSMDILISSNLERLIYELSGHDGLLVEKLMRDLEEMEAYTVPEDIKAKIDELFYAACADDAETEDAIKRCYDEFGYLIDTHTAVAYDAYKKYIKDCVTEKVVIVSTASPYKFPIGVGDALGMDVDKSEYKILTDLEALTKVKIPAPLVGLEHKKVLHEIACNKEEILQTITELL
ncbi:threonine synthase [Candidatus Epulonipiscium viviparus]|uniref:threonine synthase n=1 Tax=Candidatus Epulonipiscium viviparus TaxID=420336 RepID=UPI00016C00A6|nr:threonine synthase [Candidatus Epulopiscium viviparus]